jgi:hypothetical protein
VKIAKIIIPRANNINGSCIANLNWINLFILGRDSDDIITYMR